MVKAYTEGTYRHRNGATVTVSIEGDAKKHRDVLTRLLGKAATYGWDVTSLELLEWHVEYEGIRN